MKIDSHKFAPVPRPAARPAPAPVAASNTGIVPTAKRPSDGFESASARPGTAAAGNTGITGAGTTATATATAKRGKTNLDFELDPALEPHRDLFAKLGSRIARLDTEELRNQAIEKTSLHLSKKLNQPLDIVRGGLNNAVQAARGPITTRDPQECFLRMDRVLNHSPALQAVKDQLKGLGQSLSQDSSLKSKGQILGAAQPQLSQLNLQGRDLKTAERYLVGAVHELRARAAGSTGGGGRIHLPRFNTDSFQLPRRER